MKFNTLAVFTALYCGNASAQQSKQLSSQLRGGDSRQLFDGTNKDLTAVIHIGPMKTGSSAIQASLGIVVPEIERYDGYEDAGFAMDKGIEAFHMVGCFRPDAVPFTGGDYFEISCHPDALNQVARVAERRHNLIITAEYLTDPQTDLAKFKEFLQPWKHHRIVAYYRRYHDWLLSFHNQIYKQQTTATRKSIAEFVTHESKVNFLWNTMYLTESINRYSNYFDDIHVINIYDLPNQDVREAFYCDGLPDATESCTKFKNYAATEAKHVENPSVPLVYSDLAYYAQEMGYWTSKELGGALTMKNVASLAQHHQEEQLKKSSYDFDNAVICPEEAVLDELLQKSLDVEKELFPEFYAQQGEQEIIMHFNKIKNTKMCHVDAKFVLDNSPEWVDFFRGINNVSPIAAAK
jgi:hypothetical protein